jgi:hypothetical protein
MSPAFEAFLAKIYVDADARKRFLDDPRKAAQLAGLNETEFAALAAIDLAGLEFASDSFARKRQTAGHNRRSR